MAMTSAFVRPALAGSPGVSDPDAVAFEFPALSRFLAERGCDCGRVIDLGLADASDAEIWRYASEAECVVISKDEDFFHLAGKTGLKARLVWVRLGNCRTSTLLAAVERLWPRIEQSLSAGERVIEL